MLKIFFIYRRKGIMTVMKNSSIAQLERVNVKSKPNCPHLGWTVGGGGGGRGQSS